MDKQAPPPKSLLGLRVYVDRGGISHGVPWAGKIRGPRLPLNTTPEFSQGGSGKSLKLISQGEYGVQGANQGFLLIWAP